MAPRSNIPVSRTSQNRREAGKTRTRQKLLLAVRQLIAEGEPLSVARVARKAGVGVATAYRYYSDLESMRAEAALDLKLDDGHDDFLAEYEARVVGIANPEERLAIAQRQMVNFIRANDLDFRMYVAKAQEQHVHASARGAPSLPKGGRRLMMIEAALAPIRATWPPAAYMGLVRALLLVTGVEAWLILRDRAGLEPDAILAVNEQAIRDLFRAHQARNAVGG